MSLHLRIPASIETERLTLRPWRADDAPALYQAVIESRPRLDRWMPWSQYYTHPDAASEFIADAANSFTERRVLPLGIFDRSTGRILGSAGFHDIEVTEAGLRQIETGYWLREGAEGQGYMREAVRAEIRLVFECLGADRLIIRCDANNLRSRRVAESCGFRFDAELPGDMVDHHGNLRDTRFYSLARESYAEALTGFADEPFSVRWSDAPWRWSTGDA